MAEGMIVNPWEVRGKIDYDKLELVKTRSVKSFSSRRARYYKR